MKLSELLNKPFKVKGGGTLNLKGFSKHIIDKELGGGEITPESITPEMLENDDFRQRIRLYGHTVEEVEQLIANGKCIKCIGNHMGVGPDEDASYSNADSILQDMNGNSLDHIDTNMEYILIADNDINRGLLLKKNPHLYDKLEYRDVLDTFIIDYDLKGNISANIIGYDSY